MQDDATLLCARGLWKTYPLLKGGLIKLKVGDIHAVRDVCLEIERGDTYGIVGESGCGKTTLARCLVRAHRPSRGSVVFHDHDQQVHDLGTLDEKTLRPIRREFNMVFQDARDSLNPRKTVYQSIVEPLRWHRIGSEADRQERAAELMRAVGLETKYLERYPHEFSGGQRQRIAIARSLVTRPALVVADEPVSSLDVSVQARIITLLLQLQQERGLTYILVSHDLSVVEHVCNRVAVMYAGEFVETGDCERVFRSPGHPYTESLLSAVPTLDSKKRRRIVLPGDVPDPSSVPSGCPFHPRCPYAKQVCKDEVPSMVRLEGGGGAKCHFAGALSLRGVDDDRVQVPK